MIPLRDSGRVLRLRIRRPEGAPRYHVVPGSAMQAMVLGHVRRAAVVVESELDAILIHHLAGDLVSAAALGSASAKPDPRAAARLKSAALILNTLDYDQAGAQSFDWWAQNFPAARRWPTPQGKDPGEAYQAGVRLRDWIRDGFPEGWTIGQALLDIPPERAGSPPPPLPPVDPPEALERLRQLLARHPALRIYHTSRRVKLIYPEGWSNRNWQDFGELSQLVFFTEGVLDFVFDHPDREIGARNFHKEA